MMSYEKLDCWQGCHALALETYERTDELLKRDEDLALRLRACAIRAGARLAFGDSSGSERYRFSATFSAMGYLAEFDYLLKLAHTLGLVSEETRAALDALRGRAWFYTARMLEV
jgi:four helix bundle protein